MIKPIFPRRISPLLNSTLDIQRGFENSSILCAQMAGVVNHEWARGVFPSIFGVAVKCCLCLLSMSITVSFAESSSLNLNSCFTVLDFSLSSIFMCEGELYDHELNEMCPCSNAMKGRSIIFSLVSHAAN